MRLSSKDFRERDIYIDYPFEQVKVRWEMKTRTRYRRFYGKGEAVLSGTSRIWDEARLSGREITREEYFAD